MDPVATSKEMRECDRIAITKYRIPSILLMENAGRSVVDVMEKLLGGVSGKLVSVVCGKGNNGGDGLVVARHLYNRGAKVKVFLTSKSTQLKGDPKTNIASLRQVLRSDKSGFLQLFERTKLRTLKKQPTPEVVVDAIFGTGFSGAVGGEYKRIIQWMNNGDSRVVAIDVPSGINSDDGTLQNIAVKAHITVTMGLRKIGLMVHRGRECAGDVVVGDIGVPDIVYRRSGIRTWYVQRGDVQIMLPRRPFDAHKHSVGKIFVLAGSKGLTGAAVMCSNSAMRAGAGAVVLGVPKSLLPVIAKRVTEVMPNPLDETEEQTISARARPEIDRFVRWSDLVVLGPGLGRNEDTVELLLDLIKRIEKPILIDADGLNALAQNPGILRRRKAETIITPHTGELSRIIKLDVDQIESSRVQVAREVSRELKSILILKGAPTVTGTPEGDVYINSTGNAGMATAGAGDVLSGTVAALWAQHVPAIEAAVSGVYLHGLAGDLARERYGEMGLIATDLIATLPEVTRRTLARDGN